MNTIKLYLTKHYSFKESFVFFLLLSGLYIFPFINNNLPYRDDEVRILRGNNWGGLGRQMADILMNSLSFSFDTLANIAPLTWILTLLLFSGTLSFFIHKSHLKKTFFNHIAVSFILINPFFLQNLAYQYDCLTMSSGVCLALIAFMFDFNKKRNLFFSLLMLTAAMFFFQPVSNIFILLTALNLLVDIKNHEQKFKDTAKAFVIYTLSISLYYILFKSFFDYASANRSGIAHLNEIPSVIQNALWIFHQFFKDLMFSVGGIFIAIVIIFAVIGWIVDLFKSGFTFSIALKIIAPVIILFSLWGPFILLDESFARPRVFVTFGFIIMSLFLIIEKNMSAVKNFNLILAGIVCAYFISLCYQYNQLALQEYSYNKMLTEWISKDINDDKNLYSKNTVYLNSHPDYSPAAKITLHNNPFLKYIQMPYYNWFSRYYIENRGVQHIYKDLNNVDDAYDWKAICQDKSAKLIKENRYYNIYLISNPRLAAGNQEHVSVWFKRNDNLCQDKPNTVFKRNLFFYE